MSAFVTFLMLVRPFMLRLQGVPMCRPRAFPLRADFEWPRPDARREFLRGADERRGRLELFAEPEFGRADFAVWGDGLVDQSAGQADPRATWCAFCRFPELLA